MELGTGIFLSSIFLGLVYLYVQTKDRWNWKKIILFPLGLVTLFALGMYLYVEWDSREKPKARWKIINEEPIAQTEFLSIKLDDSAADVKFKKGEPDNVSESKSENKHAWVYFDSNNEIELLVLFKGSAIKSVLYVGKCVTCNEISGLGIGTSYEDILSELGEPTSVSSSTDDLVRIVSFKNRNLVFSLKENSVIQYGIYNPKYGPLTFSK